MDIKNLNLTERIINQIHALCKNADADIPVDWHEVADLWRDIADYHLENIALKQDKIDKLTSEIRVLKRKLAKHSK